jgi:hypothetical protein
MKYFNIVICLFEPFASDASGTAETSLRNGVVCPDEILVDAWVRLETIFRLYYLRHGFEFFDPTMVQFQSLLGFMSIKTLASRRSSSLAPDQAIDALRSTLVLAAKGVYEYGRNSYLGETVSRLLRSAMAEEDLRLLKRVVDVSSEDGDRSALMAQHVRAQFPVNIFSIAEDPTARRVSNLISAYKETEDDDKTDESQTGLA